MSENKTLKEQYDALVLKLSDQFSDADPLELDQILFIVGLQELGQLHRSLVKTKRLM